MTWWEVAIWLWFVIASATAAYFTGRNDEHRINRTCEEAIRAQAYKDGKTWMFHEMMNTPLPMTNEDYRRMYMGTWAPGIKNDTKESS